MVLTIHHLEKSRSFWIVWLLEEIGVPYEIKHYKRTEEKLAPKELLEIHPLGKSPVITDGDRTIAETGAIISYLVSEYGAKLAPPKSDKDLFIRYEYWLHFSEATAMIPVLLGLFFSMAEQTASPESRPAASEISSNVYNFYTGPNWKRNTEFMEAELAKNPQNWFVKDFSAADVILSYPVQCTSERSEGLDKYIHLKKWFDAIRERPAYKRAEEKGGKLELVK